jgi:hypothetical protein
VALGPTGHPGHGTAPDYTENLSTEAVLIRYCVPGSAGSCELPDLPGVGGGTFFNCSLAHSCEVRIITFSLSVAFFSRAWSLWPHLPSLTVPAAVAVRHVRYLSHLFVSSAVYARLRADAREEVETRRPVRRSLTVMAPRWSAPASVPPDVLPKCR